MTSRLSFWVVVAAVGLTVLQLVPVIGPMVSIFGAPVVAAYLMQIALIVIVIEAMLGRIPRFLIALPVAIYAAYYAGYVYELSRFAAAREQLNLDAARPVLTFDPSQHVISASFLDTNRLLAEYDIPATFTPGEPTIRNRLSGSRHCELLRVKNGVVPGGGGDVGIRITELNATFCFDRDRPPRPAGAWVTTDTIYRNATTLGLKTYLTTFVVSLGGVPIAEASEASVEVLSPVPLFGFGCGLNSMRPAWVCGFYVKRDYQPIYPDGVRLSDEERLAIILSLRKRTPEEIAAISRLPD